MFPSGFPSRFCGLVAARAQFGDRVDRLGRYLGSADPLADDAVAAIAALDRVQSEAAINDALDGHATEPALAQLVAHASDVPPWVEWERIDRGARFFLRTGLLGGIVLGARALVTSYASPGGNKPLVFSGRLQEAASPRLIETSRFVRAIIQHDGMRVGHEGWRITLRVRLMHAQVRRMLSASSRWRSAEWGTPINQHDMVAASLVFSVVTLGGLRKLGVDVSPEESDDFMHLWRWVSHVIGVDPALYPVTEREAEQLSALIEATQAGPDDDSRALTKALLEHGLTHPNPKQRELAARTLGLARAIARHVLGDTMADALALEPSPQRYLLPAAIATVRGLELARKHSSKLDENLVARGVRYWDQVVKNGLVHATSNFELPTTLSGLAAAR